MAEISWPGARARVELDDAERRWCYGTAKKRNWRASGGNPRAVEQGKHPVEAHYIGVLGELAYAELMGISRDEIKVYRGRGDDGVDLVLGDGTTVQVKCTTRFNDPILSLADREKKTADLFVLVAYDQPSQRVLEVCGEIWLSQLLARPEVEYRGRLCRRVPESALIRVPRPEAADGGVAQAGGDGAASEDGWRPNGEILAEQTLPGYWEDVFESAEWRRWFAEH